MLVVLIDKMLKTQIVECAAVANWVFSKEMVPEFTKCYIWEIVHLTIRYLPEGELFYLTPIPSPGTFLLPFSRQGQTIHWSTFFCSFLSPPTPLR